ncbi:MAG TPA: fibronectin type III domain-containing protein [Streptosporangiaceae bacterium]
MAVEGPPAHVGVARRVHYLLTWCAAAALCTASCSGQRAPARVEAASGAIAVAATGGVCTPTDAHGKHASLGFGCETCHQSGGSCGFGFATVAFPGGTTSAGGTITLDGAATTCQVGCHSAFGGAPTTVAWNAGPLPCTSCHTSVMKQGAVASSHLVAGVDSATCLACHDTSRHTSGQVLLVNGGATVDATCAGCHSGQGQTLGGFTPPLLVGWSDTVSGDFHGPRTACRFDELDQTGKAIYTVGEAACPSQQPPSGSSLLITPGWAPSASGAWTWSCKIVTVDAGGNTIQTMTAQPCPAGTYLDNSMCPWNPSTCYPTTRVARGYGGTLLPPFARGQDALACTACHDAHSSGNPFLLAASVNGVAVPDGALTRAGVGAEALCNACHQGERHAGCKGCHTSGMAAGGGFDPSYPAVDPEPPGSACLWCHGHEGIRFWPQPGNTMEGSTGCDHCHGFGQPPLRTTPPPLTSNCGPAGALPSVTGLTDTGVTISWQTCGVPTTAYVEYGVGTAGLVIGTAALAVDHQQVLTGLTPSTRYVFRVRSSDAFRNLVESPLQTFTTLTAGALPAPDPTAVGVVGVESPQTTMTQQLQWSAVKSPLGNPVQYRAVLSTDSGFASTLFDSGWTSATTASVTLVGLPYGCNGSNTYFWHVQARDTVSGATSAWSRTDSFFASSYDPWGC